MLLTKSLELNMKLVITDVAGAEHDLDAVILGIAGDIAILNNRLKAVEDHLGFNELEEEITDADVADSE
jgi:hypothetical protein